MFWTSSQRRLRITVALLAGLVLLGVILGHSRSAAPAAGVRYSGTLEVQSRSGAVIRQLSIHFGVGPGGRSVEAVEVGGLPSACAAGPLVGVQVSPGAAPIRPNGSFLVRVPVRERAGGSRGSAGGSGESGALSPAGTLLVSGNFLSRGRARGAVSTSFSVPGLRRCGVSGAYTAQTS